MNLQLFGETGHCEESIFRSQRLFKLVWSYYKALQPKCINCLCSHVLLFSGVPPVNLLGQNFGGLNLSSPPHVTPIRPPANPMMAGNAMTMGMPASLAANMPPSMTTGTMGMGGIPANQGMMGMNMSMNMGMATPVMMGGMAGMGVPGVGMGLTHSISPAMVPPKQDAFANFGSFGKWRSENICVWVCVSVRVWERERQNESVSMHVWHYESRNHWRTAVLENNIACFSFCFCTLWRVGISGRSPWPWRQRRAPTGAPRLEVIRCVKWCHTEDTLRAGKVSAL